MTRYRALAVDYDGTLTAGGPAAPATLDALARVRSRGIRVILATGRILSELAAEFPDVESRFDAVVAENGAVLLHAGRAQPIAAAVPETLTEGLTARRISWRRGQVLLATEARDDAAVHAELARLGLDCQLVHNRAATMILPAGVSKGSGLYRALGELGLSHHDAVGVGDAENDLSLLACCELGVAVGNAVPSLKAAADWVLSRPAGEGVVELLDSGILDGTCELVPIRSPIELGRFAEGRPCRLPVSRTRLLIAGGSGAGKSHLAGTLIERLVEMEYSVFLFDPEGDHVGLTARRGIAGIGGPHRLPTPSELPSLLQHRFMSVTADLSLLEGDPRAAWVAEALANIDKSWQATGLPHWVIFDEAHALELEAMPLDRWSCGFVTYRPELLSTRISSSVNMIFRLVEPRRAEVWSPQSDDPPRMVEFLPRRTSHVRHRHKYEHVRLPVSRRFYFRDGRGPTGRAAANLEEFRAEVERAPESVLGHHAGHGDFSRWIDDVFHDGVLAGELREAERLLGEAGCTVARRRILASIETRYASPDL